MNRSVAVALLALALTGCDRPISEAETDADQWEIIPANTDPHPVPARDGVFYFAWRLEKRTGRVG